ncbi:hypothetical protein KJ656_17630, partial [bacterium]|nr:hypothetical protein [bacterium]
MKSTTIKLALGLFCAVLLLALSSCETNEIAGPTNQDLNLAQTEGLSTSEINWIPVKPEMLEKVRALSKTGDAGKMITPQAGGIVGGNMTLDNLVHIPP